jgi:radical SAM superfamily enzyme YgiQ (UPF0313 family)
MRVLFVNYSFDRKFHAGVAALSAYLKQAGHETSLIIYDATYTPERFKQDVRAFDPQLVAFTVMTFQWGPSKELISLVKEVKDVPIIAGGYHPTLYPDEVINFSGVDFTCRGEGEETLLELVQRIEEGKIDYENVPGLSFKSVNGTTKIVHNEIRPLDGDMDELPFWDRDVFDFQSILRQRGAGTLAHTRYTMPIGGGRGCPDICTYCSNHAMLKFYRGKGRYVRKRSPEHIVAEMKALLDKYPIKFFEFWDERIAIFPQWVQEFCDVYGREIGLPWSADMRVERATMDILEPMKKSGCYMIWFGVESGDEEYRKKYLKRFMTNEHIIQAFKNCRDLGIETLSLNMIGMPNETPELAKRTIELNATIRPDNILFFTYQAFPGTMLGEMAMEEGLAPKESAYWYERPDTMLNQEAFPREDMMRLWHQWEDLRSDLESERRTRGSIAFEIDGDD